jgi:hypothetical protein
MNEINVFDFLDTTPTLAGMVVTTIAIGVVLLLAMLECLDEYKSKKGPFDDY